MRTKLVVDIDLDFLLLAVCCHQMDYKFCWGLNKYLGLEFKKQEDYSVLVYKDKLSFFSRYEHFDEMTQLKYTILSNKGSDALLAKEHAKVDYFMLLEGYYEDLNLDVLLENVKKAPSIITAFYVDPNTMHSKVNFLLE